MRTNLEMGIGLVPLEFDEKCKLLRSSNILQTRAQLESSTPCGKLLLNLLNENIQCQYEVLSSLYQSEVSVLKALGGRMRSYTRFLSGVQDFLERQGLELDKSLIKLCRDKKLKN